MPSGPVFLLTVALALCLGTAATLLAVLNWEILRESPIGRVLLLLAVVEGVFLVYHVVVLVGPEISLTSQLLHSALYTATAAMVIKLVSFQRKVTRRSPPDEDTA